MNKEGHLIWKRGLINQEDITVCQNKWGKVTELEGETDKHNYHERFQNHTITDRISRQKENQGID